MEVLMSDTDVREYLPVALSLRVVEDGPSAARLLIEGELDISGCARLSREVLELERRNLTHLVVDLSDLLYADSAGLGSLVLIVDRAHAAGTEVRFIPPPDPVAEVFEMTGVARILPFV
jgi:anti-anti-sigma factor